MRLHNQEFRDGRLVRESFVDVPDPPPTREEQMEARLVAEIDRQTAAVREALTESGDARLAAVAAEIERKARARASLRAAGGGFGGAAAVEAATPPRRSWWRRLLGLR